MPGFPQWLSENADMRYYSACLKLRPKLVLSERPLLIGQAHAKLREDQRAHPLFPYPTGKAGHRLWKLTGWRLEEYMHLADKLNLLPFFPGRSASGRGDHFPRQQAQKAAEDMRGKFAARTVVIIGNATWETLVLGEGKGSYKPFTLYNLLGGTIGYIPHTSGINDFWNSSERAVQASQFFSVVREKTFGPCLEKINQEKDSTLPAS